MIFFKTSLLFILTLKSLLLFSCLLIFPIFIISRISSFEIKKKVLGIISIIKTSKLLILCRHLFISKPYINIYKVEPHDDHFCSPKAISYESTELETTEIQMYSLTIFSK